MGYYYDEDFNYRIFEVLRNYCQHFSSVPIDIFSDFEGVSYIFINKQELGKDAKAKNKIERELASPLYMELNSAVRDWLVVVTHIYGLVLDFLPISQVFMFAIFYNNWKRMWRRVVLSR